MATLAASDRLLPLERALEEIQRRGRAFPMELRQRLDRDGYAIVPRAIAGERVERLRQRVATIMEEEGPGGFHENRAQLAKRGSGRVADLVNKGQEFDEVWTHPLLLGAAWHVLRAPCRLYCLNANGVAPGQPAQGLHTDTPTPVPGGPYTKLQCIVPLVDFTADNGATRALPGSHLVARTPHPPGMAATDPHPDQIPLCAPAGSLILYNGNMYHGAGANHTREPRYALVMAYQLRDLPQLCDQAEFLRVATARRLGPFERWLLDA